MTSAFARRTSSWALAASLGAAPAAAEPPSAIDLRWEAPPGCPQKDEVRGRIERLLGSAPREGQLTAEGTIERADGRFRLTLVMRAGDLAGTRSIDAISCEDLAGAAAVAIGLLVRSAETGGSLAPAPQPTIAAEPAPPSEPPAQAEPRRWRVPVQAPLLGLGVGPLPRVTLGVGAGVGVELDAWRLRLSGMWWKQKSVPAPDAPEFGADVQRATASLRACRGFGSSSLEIAPCFATALDHVSARGTGQDIAPADRFATWVAVGAGLEARLHLASRLSLLAQADGQLELSRPEIWIDGVGRVAKLAPATFTAAISPEWIF
jgi:hypothetical protein